MKSACFIFTYFIITLYISGLIFSLFVPGAKVAGGRSSRIRRSSLEQLLAHIPLIEYLTGFIDVRRSGANAVACCPFHAEKSPSFYIYTDHYHCFGCGAHGNVLDYEMHRTGLPFGDVARDLAERFRFPLEYEEGAGHTADAISQEMRQLMHIMAECSKAYQKYLMGRHGQVARDYLHSRGFSEGQIQEWGIGLSPVNSVLTGTAEKRGWSVEDLVKVGILRRRESDGSLYDFFRNRILIPIKDEKGHIVAMGGRIFGEPVSSFAGRTPPKYINSPETLLYSKSKILFNFNKARKNIVQQKSTVVVEGYMDCMALANAGVENVVAVLGTALTEDHVRRLATVASHVSLCFDNDKAGREALRRSFETAYPLNLVSLSSIRLPSGKDPDDFVRKQGVSSFRNLVSTARPLIRDACEISVEGLPSQEAKLREIKARMLPILSKNPDRDQREVALKEVAAFLGLSTIQSLLDATQQIEKRRHAKEQSAGTATKVAENPPLVIAPPKQSLAGNWQVNSDNELRFLLAVFHAELSELPDRLVSLVTGNVQADPHDVDLCGMTLANVLNSKSREILEAALLLMNHPECEKLYRAPKDLLQALPIEGQALQALICRDEEQLAKLGLASILEGKGKGVRRPDKSKQPFQVFDINNGRMLMFLLSDLRLSLDGGHIRAVLESHLLSLELEYINAVQEKTLIELSSLSEGTPERELLKERARVIEDERQRRQQKLRMRGSV
jgi:DNA primase